MSIERHAVGLRPQVGGDAHGQGADQHPDHEANVEVQECAQERGPVTGFSELAQIHVSTGSEMESSFAFRARKRTRSTATAQNFSSGCFDTASVAAMVR